MPFVIRTSGFLLWDVNKPRDLDLHCTSISSHSFTSKQILFFSSPVTDFLFYSSTSSSLSTSFTLISQIITRNLKTLQRNEAMKILSFECIRGYPYSEVHSYAPCFQGFPLWSKYSEVSDVTSSLLAKFSDSLQNSVGVYSYASGPTRAVRDSTS